MRKAAIDFKAPWVIHECLFKACKKPGRWIRRTWVNRQVVIQNENPFIGGVQDASIPLLCQRLKVRNYRGEAIWLIC